MGLVVVLLAGALAVGWVCGGTFEALIALPLRGRFLVVAAVGAQLAGAVAARVGDAAWPYVTGLAISAGLVLGFCLGNVRRAGVPLVALGLFANTLVVGLNAAMPVSSVAAARAGVSTRDIVTGSDPRHVLAHDGTTLRWLGDVVPVPLPLRPEVASPGDVLIAAGLVELVVVAMRGRWRRRSVLSVTSRGLEGGFEATVRHTQPLSGHASQALATMSRRS